MTKTYIEGESKEQRKARKRKEKQKAVTVQPIASNVGAPVKNSPSTSDKLFILCLKHGQKYSADYVNKLYNMTQRHCTLEHEFVCMTEDPAFLLPGIKTIPLPKGIEGWWCKPYMFSKDLPLDGSILYLDLDVVISANIDKLFTYQPNNWCTVRDYTRAMRPKWPKYNSSVVRFKTGELDHVWSEFNKDPKSIMRQHFGDQDWLFAATRHQQAMLYPDSWTQSWKWEVRASRDFALGGRRGSRKFKTIENVVPRVECCVVVFHGDPNPEMCEDPWVLENWV